MEGAEVAGYEFGVSAKEHYFVLRQEQLKRHFFITEEKREDAEDTKLDVDEGNL